MNRRVLIGIFDSEVAILDVTDAARRRGLKIVDVFAPYAVHGLDTAMGLERSKLPWVRLPEGVPAFEAYYEMSKLWPAASLERRRAILGPKG